MGQRGPPRKPRHLKLLEDGKRVPSPDARPLGEDSRCGSKDTSSGVPCRRAAGWGTPRGVGHCKDHAESAPGARPPSFLSDRAAEVWIRVYGELARLNILTVLDHGVFASYCIATAGIEECSETLADADWVIAGAKGDRKHPAFQILRDLMEKQRMFAKELGLTPSARTSFDLPEREEPSKLGKLLAGRPG
ncbi:phage terminase small subunit P27 family [Candidatus Palauibacter sp.]|uniref:phage terminase small subunit P27 family n=1 Tax=Candidatus Palauibacter sp. TaxID=3101350 RepID=UPI003CC58BA9